MYAHLFIYTKCENPRSLLLKSMRVGSICDPSARNESHVGSVQVEKMGNMHDMG